MCKNCMNFADTVGIHKYRRNYDEICMTHKRKSEMSSQKIDTSADIHFGSLALLEGFVTFFSTDFGRICIKFSGLLSSLLCGTLLLRVAKHLNVFWSRCSMSYFVFFCWLFIC